MTAIAGPQVQLDRVHYRYSEGQSPVLDAVDWQVAEGSFVVVAGPSGSGKSTLLRCLNGLVPHFAGGSFGGDVIVSGHNTRFVPTRVLARGAGFVFQDPDAQAVAGRIEDEIAFGMEQLGVAQPAMARRVEEVLDLLGIEHLRSREMSSLSGGERQRVAIAAALAMSPRLILLDEPTSQLDPAAADELIMSLVRLNEDFGVTVVLAEHRLERVVAYADRLRVLNQGRQAVDGSPREVFQRIESRLAPPVSRAGSLLGWKPLPLSVKEGRAAAREWTLSSSNHLTDAARPDTEPLLRVSKATLKYGSRVVLRSVHLDVKPGEIVVLMGRNGTGKTTLLRAIAGLHRVSEGRIAIGGQAVASIDPIRRSRQTGFLPQRARALLFSETVEDELRFTLDRRGNAGKDLDEVLQEFGLDKMAACHPFALSAGEQERLALAVTMAGNPALLLLDEPTRGLDPFRKDHLAGMLRDRAAQGAAVMVATHDVEFAAQIATWTVMLGHQQVISTGAPREMLGGSLAWSTQLSKVFGHGVLTFDDLQSLGQAGPAGQVDRRY